jgi:hypothetical protein
MLAAFDGDASGSTVARIGADPHKRFSLQSKYKRGTELELTSWSSGPNSIPSHNGKLSCFFAGISTFLSFSIASARAIRFLVECGMMTSSM